MAGTLNLSGFKLTFDDEFNTFSSSPDGKSGTYQTTFYFGGRGLPSNGEQETYSDSSTGTNPFQLQNGALDITAQPGGPSGYTSGLITTEQSFSQTYGYFEMRAKLPQGQGMWPAFWLLPTDKSWPPEIDALEAFGAPNANGEGGANTYHVGAISGNSSQSNGGWQNVSSSIYSGYHTYGVDWEPDHITYYFDGQQVAQINTPSDANKPMYMLANLAVGGNWPGSPAGETSQMQIDYIRAYSSNPNAQAVALQTMSSPDGANTSNLDGAVAANGSSPSPAPAPAPTPAPAPAPTPAPAPAPAPTPVPVTTGPDTITLHVSGDAWKGDPQFTVTVDGKQVGGTYDVSASHAAGQWQDIVVHGDFGTAGPSQVQVNYTNDLWGGGATTDRNLYVGSINVNGHTFAGSSAQDTASLGQTDPNAADMFVPGTATFNTTGSGRTATPSPAPTPAPAPAPAPSPTPVPVTTGPDTITLHVSGDAWKGDPQFTVTVDGKQVGGTYDVSASHAAGQWQDIVVHGDFGTAGPSQVQVNYTNDLWGGGATTDRNLYVGSINVNGQTFAGASAQDNANTGITDANVANMFVNGTATFNTTGSGRSPTPSPSPTPAPAGSDTLVLHLSEDAYQGNAQFTVSVDGKQLGAAQSVTASHMAGDSDAFTFTGDFGAGSHTVAVNYINDLWGGTVATDRNLYVDSITFDGQAVANSSAPLYSDGAANFTVTSPSPSPSPAPAPTPAPGGSAAAQPIPTEPRTYIAPDSSGTAHGTAGADDIFVTGHGQTLIGNGGDDIFHIGTFADTKIVAGASGVSTVATYATHYTLASGVDDLMLQGNYAHVATGNGLANYIYGSNGNDTINGGGGNVTIQVGTGSNLLTGGGQHDIFVFPKAADHDNVITDFHAGHDVLDLRGLVQDAGYHGTDPVADHVLQITQHGSDTVVSVDPAGSSAAHTVVTLHNVVASSLHAGTDYLWH